MKILHVIASMDPISGGPCQGIRNSNQELSKLGIDREIVSLDDPNAPFLGKDPFPVYALGPGKTRWSYNPSLYHWLVHNIPRFDVVVVNGLWLYHGYAVRKAVRHLNKLKAQGKLKVDVNTKFYVMTHGMLDPYFQRASSRWLKAIRNWVYWKLIESKVVNDADGLLFTCETELLLAREPFRPYHPKQELNVGYGITAPPQYSKKMREAFNNACPNTLNEEPYILYLSRIHEKKGIELLLKAYKQIIAASTASGAVLPKLVIAGPGLETSYGKKIKELAKTMPGYIVFPGMLTGDAKWGAFYGCSAFVLPSHQENFGIAVVEALACYKPVLISDQVNIWPEVMECKGGIVARDTFEGTKDLLDKWMQLTDKEKQEMGYCARQCYETKFHIGLVSKQFLDAIAPPQLDYSSALL